MQSVSEELSDPVVIDFAVRGDVYRFISRVGEPATDKFWKEVAALRTELGTYRSGEPVEQMNRRETYRVLSPADNAVVPTIKGELRSGTKTPQAFEGRLIDFSFGGCAMVVQRSLSKAGELFIYVNGRTESRFIHASIVYERKLRRVGGYRVGLRFQPVDSADIKLLRSAWMMMQRTVAVVRSEEYWSIFEE